MIYNIIYEELNIDGLIAPLINSMKNLKRGIKYLVTYYCPFTEKLACMSFSKITKHAKGPYYLTN